MDVRGHNGMLDRRTFVKRAGLVALVGALAPAALASCKHAPDSNNAPASSWFSSWANTDLIGSVTSETSALPVEDFHLNVNRDWLLTVKVPQGRSRHDAFTARADKVDEHLQALLEDNDPTVPGFDAVREVHAACLDEATRESLGISPLRPYIEKVVSLSTLGSLSAYLAFAPQLIVDPFIRIQVHPDRDDPGRNAVYLGPGTFTLGDPGEYLQRSAFGAKVKATNDGFFKGMLARMGYSSQRAQSLIDDAFSLESSLAGACTNDAGRARSEYVDASYNRLSFGELVDKAPAFPLAAILGAVGFSEDAIYVLEEPAWLARLDNLYTPEHMEAFKALLIEHMLMGYGMCLDRSVRQVVDAWRNAIDGTSYEDDLRLNARRIRHGFFRGVLAEQFVRSWRQDEDAKDVDELASHVRDVLANQVYTGSRLSDQTRWQASFKLSATSLRIGAPERMGRTTASAAPYAGFDLASAPSQDLVGWCAYAWRYDWGLLPGRLSDPVEETAWRISPLDTQVRYHRDLNALEVPAALIGAGFHDADAPSASRGALGALIARELVHAVDEGGSYHGADGRRAPWWTDEDRAAFSEISTRVSDRYGDILVLPLRPEDGGRVGAEGLADIAALQCVEALEDLEEANHAELLVAFARLWRAQMTGEYADSYLSASSYPFGFVRTNLAVQQDAWFHETYGTQEGDAMYLAEDERLKIW